MSISLSVGAQKLLRLFGLDTTFVVSNAAKPPSGGLLTMDMLMTLLEERPVKPLRSPHKIPAWILRPHIVRDYQWCVAKLSFRRSGFIVAPCGSGKTLMGLLMAVLNGGRFLVLTTRYAKQWKTTLEQFFVPFGASRVSMFGDDDGYRSIEPPDAVIATYNAFVASTKQSMTTRVLKQLPYETVILDEAHGAAARTNLKLLDALHAKYIYALTATKVREDAELEKLEARVGPTLVEVDRHMLVKQGFVADVTCLHLIVEYTPVLEAMVGRTTSLAIQPFKTQLLCFALQKLMQKGHRPLVFCDDLFCLHWMARIVKSCGIPVTGIISMKTPNDERDKNIQSFQSANPTSALFLSRTGDEALDIPGATAGIVFWNHWASRRQIVQRLGRIARLSDGPSPVFLILLSDDTKELEVSTHREMYLRNHGFATVRSRQQDSAYGISIRRGVDEYVNQLRLAWASESKTTC